MKALKTFVFLSALTYCSFSYAQNDKQYISQRAILFADSLVSAYHYSNWNAYLNISYPGIIKYYGGKQGFQDYIQRARNLNTSADEPREKLELLQVENDDAVGEWQCVVRKIRNTFIDNKKAIIISYMVGQSTDGGRTWKYFDVALNSVENLIYIMPDISGKLTIPQRQVIFEKDQLVRQQ